VGFRAGQLRVCQIIPTNIRTAEREAILWQEIDCRTMRPFAGAKMSNDVTKTLPQQTQNPPPPNSILRELLVLVCGIGCIIYMLVSYWLRHR
jgi:hypothetical protein